VYAVNVGFVDGFERDGLRFRVRDGGPVNGEPVVLLHGFPQDSTCWREVEPLLHAGGCRTLAPDQRGYSPQARPRHTGAYAVRELVADILGLLDAAGAERAHVVGHDWGAAVAWELAIRAPHRVVSLTTLSTPHPTAFRQALRTPDQRKRSWYMAAFQVPVLPERVLLRRLGPTLRRSGLPPERVAHYVARFATTDDLRGPIDWYRDARPRSRSRLRRDQAAGPQRPPRLTMVTVPTTYLWGNQDEALGARGANDTAGYVSAPYRFVELEAGHWLPECQPEVVAREVLLRVAGTTTT
jgi:pimeloyl-ACP methyl ester carboxylesterase